MSTIIREQIIASPITQAQIPVDAEFMQVGVQAGVQFGDPVVWFATSGDEPVEPRTFRLIPTGVAFDCIDMVYLGTVVISDHRVMHVFVGDAA